MCRWWVGAFTLGLGLACANGVPDVPPPPPTPPPRPAPAPTPVRDAVDRITVLQDGVERTAWLHVPKGAAGPMPLVVVFHHAAGDGRRIAEWFDGWFDRGVILAFPNGAGKGGEDDPVWDGVGRGNDSKADIAFVESMVDQIARAHPVAPDQVFATGFAAGGFMTWQVACWSDVFDGFAPVGNTLPRKLAENCPTVGLPRPLLLVAGTDDPTSLWTGRDESLAVMDSIDLWLKKNDCDPESEAIAEIPDVDKNDGSRPRRHTWTCKGAPVSLLEIYGGGHAWPRKDAPGARANRDIDTADEIFAFFGIRDLPTWKAP